MNLNPLGLAAARLAAGVPAQRAQASSGQLLTACRLGWEQDARLVALWASDERDLERGFCVHVLLEGRDGLTLLDHTMPGDTFRYPDLTPIFPAANRMQRATFDLMGVAAEADDQRPWLWLASWPIDRFPLRRDFEARPEWEPGQEEYAFVRVTGDGVHEVPVGPVHAGIIEPGHFRFQVVGEKVLRLEERLGYTHKGIEKRFEALTIAGGMTLAGRISGDSTVGYAWAYAQAVESIAGIDPPPRAALLRALCLERERLANHLGDLGALGNDAGFAFGLAQFSRLREDVLRRNGTAFGHRLLMDVVSPGGVARDLDAEHALAMREEAKRLTSEIVELRAIYDEHSGVQDRFRGCGTLKTELARQLGVIGLAGRASGLPRDLRRDLPCAPYDALDVAVAQGTNGDVAARVAVRFDEALESLRLSESIVARLLDPGTARAICEPVSELSPQRLGIGYVEGWRGPLLVALESGPRGAIRRCHPQDPSWTAWPAIEHAVIGNIVADFPLINKSFNLAYSGHDL
ncbi:MAG: NADH-quinone oxidoreductase subunit C [Casimicrobiaceae bacterium]